MKTITLKQYKRRLDYLNRFPTALDKKILASLKELIDKYRNKIINGTYNEMMKEQSRV